eukprot:g34396.t1
MQFFSPGAPLKRGDVTIKQRCLTTSLKKSTSQVLSHSRPEAELGQREDPHYGASGGRVLPLCHSSSSSGQRVRSINENALRKTHEAQQETGDDP